LGDHLLKARIWVGPLCILTLAFLSQFFEVFNTWDEQVTDAFARLKAPDPSRLPLCVVEISDATIQEMGYPVPRKAYAHLLDVLARGGARWVVLDIVFDTPSPDTAADSALARALRRHPNTTLSGQLPDPEMATSRTGNLKVLQTRESVRPLDAFLASTPRWGVVLNKQEADGVVRRYRPSWPDLAGQPQMALGIRALVDAGWLDSSLLLSSPWNNSEGFRIRFCGASHSFPYHSLERVVDDSAWTSRSEDDWGERLDLGDSLIKSGAFKDRIVLVGASAKTLQDIYKIPGRGNVSMPGVELHAHAMATVLTRSSLKDLPRSLHWLLMLGWTLFLLWWMRRLKDWWQLPLGTLLSGLFWSAAALSCAVWGQLILPVAIGWLAATGVLLVASTERYLDEAARKREITRTFGQYVSPDVVKMMIADPSKVVMGGSRAEISVLFSDFQGFTSISEQQEPEALVQQLGDALTQLSQAILDAGGTLDKFMGDAIMAEFGMPLSQPDKALRACKAALGMQAELMRLRTQWQREGLAQLHMRIGIATGMAIFGNLGSRQKFDFTALGDTVNLGSRLEGMNKHFGTSILIDATTREQAGEAIVVRALGAVAIPGKQEPVDVWELLGLS
jgi:adenylate cyclase